MQGAAPLPSDVRVVVVRSDAALRALGPAWAALWRRVPDTTPFQHPAWLLPWWSAFAHGELRVVALVRDRRLVGVLPLYREMEGMLLPLGVGTTDWLDVLVEDGVALEPVMAALRRLTGGTRLVFPGLPDWSPLHAVAGVGSGGEVCPTLALPAGADMAAVLPDAQARNLRHTGNRARRAGPLEIEAATSASAPDLLEALFRLHAARWARRGEAGVLADPTVQVFHRAAVPALADAGLLRMHAVRVGGHLAAVHYGLGDGRRAYHYLGGFDPELAALGPGVLAVGHAIAEALREGAREFHFLRGGEPYKYAWGAVDRPCRTRCFALEEFP